MKLSNRILFFACAMLTVTGCGLLPNSSAQPTRAATQTPLIVFVPVTTTPEPATVTPLATVTSSGPQPTATRTATTRAAVVVRPTATRTKTSAPVVVGPAPTAAPSCAFAPPNITEPGILSQVDTFETKPGTAAIIFRWERPDGVGGDDIAYMIQMNSQAGKENIGVTVYISDNQYNSDSQKQTCSNRSCFIYDADRVQYLKRGSESATVSWYLSVVKFTGTIDKDGYLTGNATECKGSRTAPRTVIVKVK